MHPGKPQKLGESYYHGFLSQPEELRNRLLIVPFYEDVEGLHVTASLHQSYSNLPYAETHPLRGFDYYHQLADQYRVLTFIHTKSL